MAISIQIAKDDVDAWLDKHVTAKELSEKYLCSRGLALSMLMRAVSEFYGGYRKSVS